MILFLVRCSSTPTEDAIKTSILEPVEETKQEQQLSPSFTKLVGILGGIGAEAIGMEYENEAILDLLCEVFSDPKVMNRKLKLIYTGLQMSYDSNAESLTVGGLTNKTAILNYIQRYVPLRPSENATESLPVNSFRARPRTIYPEKSRKTPKKIQHKAPRNTAPPIEPFVEPSPTLEPIAPITEPQAPVEPTPESPPPVQEDDAKAFEIPANDVAPADSQSIDAASPGEMP